MPASIREVTGHSRGGHRGRWAGAPASECRVQGWLLSKHRCEGHHPSCGLCHTHTPSSRQTQFTGINVPTTATGAAQPALSSSEHLSGDLYHSFKHTTQRNKCHSILTCIYILESPLDNQEIQPVHPKGNQPKHTTQRNKCHSILTCIYILESPLDNQKIRPVHPKGNQPEYSLETLMLKLKLQYFGT